MSPTSSKFSLEFANTPRLWGLSPLFWTPLSLFVSDIAALKPHEDVHDVYFYRSHPVRSATVLGVVVAIDRRPLMITWSVDDGTGVIPCIQWLNYGAKKENAAREESRYALGDLVRCTGSLTEYRNERQINLTQTAPVSNPDEENVWWLQVLRLRCQVYEKPFILPEDVQERVAQGMGQESYVDLRYAMRDGKDEVVDGEDSLRKAYSSFFALAPRNTTEYAFRSLVATYLKVKNYTTFQPTDLLKGGNNDDIEKLAGAGLHPSDMNVYLDSTWSIRAAAEKVLEYEHRTLNPAPERLQALLSRTAHKLAREGIVYLSHPATDTYTLIKHETGLGKTVREIVRGLLIEPKRNSNPRDATLRIDAVFDRVRDLAAYRNVSRTLVIESIEVLVGEGELFEVAKGEWKCCG